LLFEVPFILICIFVSVFLSFLVRKIEEDKEIPLPELAEKLLLELDEVNQLEATTRVLAKKQWKDKYEVYLERKKMDLSKDKSKINKIRAVK